MSIDLIDHLGSDATVVNAARVSFNKWVDPTLPLREQDNRLIKYLADHDHNSPFFHAVVTLRIRMPIYIAREWFRHTVGFARNEVSRRYVTDKVECILPTSIRERDPNKKQGSKPTEITDCKEAAELMQKTVDDAIAAYERLLELGVAPELARVVLPQAMKTEFIETGSLYAYARLYKLRTGSDAQAEIREYAREVGQVLSKLYPVSWAALIAG